jgi:hypothetical protein
LCLSGTVHETWVTSFSTVVIRQIARSPAGQRYSSVGKAVVAIDGSKQFLPARRRRDAHACSSLIA